MRNEADAPLGLDVQAVAVGVGFSLAASFVVAVLTALIVSFSSVTETYLPGILYASGILIVALGAAVGARKADRLGWVHGGLVGVASMATGVLLIAILYPGNLSAIEIARQGILAFVTGAVAGILRVNL